MKVTHYKLVSKSPYCSSSIENKDLGYLIRLYDRDKALGYKVELFRVGEELIESNFQKELKI